MEDEASRKSAPRYLKSYSGGGIAEGMPGVGTEFRSWNWNSVGESHSERSGLLPTRGVQRVADDVGSSICQVPFGAQQLDSWCRGLAEYRAGTYAVS